MEVSLALDYDDDNNCSIRESAEYGVSSVSQLKRLGVKRIIVIASNWQQNSPADPKRDQLARMRST